jgi:hypothetical protein
MGVGVVTGNIIIMAGFLVSRVFAVFVLAVMYGNVGAHILTDEIIPYILPHQLYLLGSA